MRYALFIILVLAAAPLAAQEFLDKLERELEAEAAAPPVAVEEAKPPAVPLAPATKTPGYLGLIADDSTGAVRVELVRGGGPAEKAGILIGDVVEDIDGRPVVSLDAMGELLASRGAGERVAMRLRRDKVLLFTNVVLGRRPGTTLPAPAPAAAEPAPAPVDALDALDQLDRLLADAPPADAEAAVPLSKPKPVPGRIDALENELRAVRSRIAELERQIAEIAAEE